MAEGRNSKRCKIFWSKGKGEYLSFSHFTPFLELHLFFYTFHAWKQCQNKCCAWSQALPCEWVVISRFEWQTIRSTSDNVASAHGTLSVKRYLEPEDRNTGADGKVLFGLSLRNWVFLFLPLCVWEREKEKKSVFLCEWMEYMCTYLIYRSLLRETLIDIRNIPFHQYYSDPPTTTTTTTFFNNWVYLIFPSVCLTSFALFEDMISSWIQDQGRKWINLVTQLPLYTIPDW